jgi:glycosyltransferase involved in cell wall biosynthesis
MRVVQITSVHPWHDTRVFLKMCCSVAAAGHEVHLVVPREDGPRTEVKNGVTLHFVPLPAGRLSRMTTTVARVLGVARELDGDVYQFHDPEILPRAVRFQDQAGKPVVFDSHEDYRLQILYKHYIPKWLRPVVGKGIGMVEDRVVGALAGVIAATPSIAERFSWHPHCVLVQNFPMQSEFEMTDEDIANRDSRRFGFVGVLCEIRGAKKMTQAIDAAGPDLTLELGGLWCPPNLREECRNLPGWCQVIEHGFMDRTQMREMFQRVGAGLILMHPTQSYLTAYPVKMFEYMAAGLPIIASDFPMWRPIVGQSNSGILVDPLDHKAIGRAMRMLADEPQLGMEMGTNGRTAVKEAFNWELELVKLLHFYDGLVPNRTEADIPRR